MASDLGNRSGSMALPLELDKRTSDVDFSRSVVKIASKLSVLQKVKTSG